ncbi:putative sulfate exporter family transporter [Peribacillus frigoritolerans]|nr:putative sulfate exporter family transporter [Peribacillus frigoritolerans]MED3711511.1 putative sulfate exporter family transporter [Peribacillus frigoritolerans]MED3892220.1 putative sulfate exporter family transporter [Peribacillus frigoritolerans]ULM99664.1 putative sulfate exporter family transporter [Peribacillus frigoritolerans]
MISGIGFTLIIAVLGFILAALPGLNHIGPLACAILLAVVYRQIFGYPQKLRTGIQFSSKILLRFAIILYGLKLNMIVIFHQGFPLLLRGTITIIFSIAVLMIIAKWLKADFNLSLLLSVGTGICGAAAIAAVSPIIKAKDEDTAMGVGIIALVGTVFSIIYTLIYPFLSIGPMNYGNWVGISLHEIGHVALAAAPAGQDALAHALLAKLTRVFLLIPVCFILMLWMKKKGKIEGEARFEFPWFLIGFIVMSFVGSYIIGNKVMVSQKLMSYISDFTSFMLTMSMTGLGLNICLNELRTKAIRPLIAIIITSVLLSSLTYISL